MQLIQRIKVGIVLHKVKDILLVANNYPFDFPPKSLYALIVHRFPSYHTSSHVVLACTLQPVHFQGQVNNAELQNSAEPRNLNSAIRCSALLIFAQGQNQ